MTDKELLKRYAKYLKRMERNDLETEVVEWIKLCWHRNYQIDRWTKIFEQMKKRIDRLEDKVDGIDREMIRNNMFGM